MIIKKENPWWEKQTNLSQGSKTFFSDVLIDILDSSISDLCVRVYASVFAICLFGFQYTKNAHALKLWLLFGFLQAVSHRKTHSTGGNKRGQCLLCSCRSEVTFYLFILFYIFFFIPDASRRSLWAVTTEAAVRFNPHRVQRWLNQISFEKKKNGINKKFLSFSNGVILAAHWGPIKIKRESVES